MGVVVGVVEMWEGVSLLRRVSEVVVVGMVVSVQGLCLR